MFKVRPINLDLFAVPLCIMTLGEESREMNKELIEDIYKEESSTEGKKRSGFHVWQSDVDLEQKYDSFKKFSSLIFEASKPILSRAGFSNNFDQYLNPQPNMWANVNRSPDAFHVPHMHSNGTTLFTGVYFPTSGFRNGVSISDSQDLNIEDVVISSTSPVPGSIVFQDPAMNVKAQVRPISPGKFKNYPYNGGNVHIIPKEGTIIFFPHYLTHFVMPTCEKNFTRISIAFNIFNI